MLRSICYGVSDITQAFIRYKYKLFINDMIVAAAHVILLYGNGEAAESIVKEGWEMVITLT